MVGDSNVVLHNSEKRGGSIIRYLFKEKMEDIIRDWDMDNIKPIKGKFT